MTKQILALSRETSSTLVLKKASSNLFTVTKSAYQLNLCAYRRTSIGQTLPAPFEAVPWTPQSAPTIIKGILTYPHYADPDLLHKGSQLFLIHPPSLICHIILHVPQLCHLLWFSWIFIGIKGFQRILVNFSEVLKRGDLPQTSYRVPMLPVHAYLLTLGVSNASYRALRKEASLLVIP